MTNVKATSGSSDMERIPNKFPKSDQNRDELHFKAENAKCEKWKYNLSGRPYTPYTEARF